MEINILPPEALEFCHFTESGKKQGTNSPLNTEGPLPADFLIMDFQYPNLLENKHIVLNDSLCDNL